MNDTATPRVITEPLGGSPLSLLAQRGAAPREWYDPAPRTRDEWLARARTIGSRASSLLGAFGPALHATGAAGERIARVVRDQGIVVTTGQQPGLFGGAGYTWTKALAANALADALQRATGIATAAIFWAATDDADAAEASETAIAVVGGAERLVALPQVAAGTPMCAAPLGDVSEQFGRLAASAGSALHSDVLIATREAYHSGATVGDAYVALLESLLNPLGIAVLDAGHPRVRELARPVTARAVERADAVSRALTARSAAIRDAGYDAQVEEIERLSLVFDWTDGVKSRLPVGASVPAGAASLSPNVLLRPVVERAILPTVAYVAGPGELAYFAQVSAVADTIDAARPLALPRWSSTVLEPRVERALARLELGVADVARPSYAEGVLARRAMPEGAAAAVELARRQAAALGDALAPLAARQLIDDRVAVGHRRQAERLAERLERRLLAAVKRRETETTQLLGTVRGSLWPLGKKQERALNYVPFFARYGPALIDRMRAAADDWARGIVGE